VIRPIRLHLDTSDYGAMHVAVQGASTAHIRDKLKEMVHSGSLEIGLSYHVIFEFLQRATPQYREDRLARANLLRELCGQNAFPHPIDLGQGHYFSKDGVWFPRAELALFDVETLIQNLINTAVRDLQLRRGERRALSKRKHFVKWARDNPARVRQLIAVQPWAFPLGEGFIETGAFKRYLFGETTREEANGDILACFTDPMMMYVTWFEHLGRENPLAEISEQLANKIIALLTDLRDQVDNNIPVLRTEIKKALSAHKHIPEAREKLVQLDREVRKFSAETWSPHVLTEHTPGGWTKLVGEKSGLIAAQILYAFHKESRKIRRSDVIDLLHAMYLPYTDLWRGDRAFSDLLIKHKVDFSERVVTSLADLPKRIEAEFGSRLTLSGPAGASPRKEAFLKAPRV
jgi:hypothetical protein